MKIAVIIKNGIEDGLKNQIVIIITHSRDFMLKGAYEYEIKNKAVIRKNIS